MAIDLVEKARNAGATGGRPQRQVSREHERRHRDAREDVVVDALRDLAVLRDAEYLVAERAQIGVVREPASSRMTLIWIGHCLPAVSGGSAATTPASAGVAPSPRHAAMMPPVNSPMTTIAAVAKMSLNDLAQPRGDGGDARRTLARRPAVAGKVDEHDIVVRRKDWKPRGEHRARAQRAVNEHDHRPLRGERLSLEDEREAALRGRDHRLDRAAGRGGHWPSR